MTTFATLDPQFFDHLVDQARALATPHATVQALSDKLLTLTSCPRWVRVAAAEQALAAASLNIAA